MGKGSCFHVQDVQMFLQYAYAANLQDLKLIILI